MAIATTPSIKDIDMDKIEFSMGKFNETHNAHRIIIKYNKEPFVVKTKALYSYGIQENLKEGVLTGYCMPLLCDAELTALVEAVEAKCKDYMVSMTSVLNKKRNYYDTLDTLYYRMVEGKVDPDAKPKLYARVNTCFRDPSKITTHIKIANRWESNAVQLPKSEPYPTGPINCIVGLHFDNVYCGTKPSMQVKAKWIMVGERHEEACAAVEDLPADTINELFTNI